MNMDEIVESTQITPNIDCDSGQGDRIMRKRPFLLDKDDSDLYSSRICPRPPEAGEFKENIPALHYPIFDLDFPATLIPSRTPGHFHLIIEKQVTTTQYQAILDAFVNAGIVQLAWAERLNDYGEIFLRFPAFFKKLVHRARIIYGEKK